MFHWSPLRLSESNWIHVKLATTKQEPKARNGAPNYDASPGNILLRLIDDEMLVKPPVMQRDITTNSCVIMHEEDGTESQNTAPNKIQNSCSLPLLCLPSVIILLSSNNVNFINSRREKTYVQIQNQGPSD